MPFTWWIKIGNAERMVGVSNEAASADTPENVRRQQERAIQCVRDWYGHWRTYHNHKETLAIAGITFQLTTFGTALISKEWPPFPPYLTFALITVAWLLILVYLKWQLRRRRWAAVRIAGADKLLAKWILEPPTTKELKPEGRENKEYPSRWHKFIDYFGASKHVSPPIEAEHPSKWIYPAALVDLWWKEKYTEPKSTDAIFHERFIVIVGWCLFGLLALRTLCPDAYKVWLPSYKWLVDRVLSFI
jgi:hypothetical protein